MLIIPKDVLAKYDGLAKSIRRSGTAIGVSVAVGPQES